MGTMPPPLGQPITVVEQQSSNPAILRFETNRPLSGMGHERYTAPPAEILDRPVDELARRLFAAGGVAAVHINGSVVTVTLTGGRRGEGLADVVRSLFLHYPPQAQAPAVTPPADEADRAPEATADPAEAPAAQEAEEPAAADPPAAEVVERSATEATPAPDEATRAPDEAPTPAEATEPPTEA